MVFEIGCRVAYAAPDEVLSDFLLFISPAFGLRMGSGWKKPNKNLVIFLLSANYPSSHPAIHNGIAVCPQNDNNDPQNIGTRMQICNRMSNSFAQGKIMSSMGIYRSLAEALNYQQSNGSTSRNCCADQYASAGQKSRIASS